MLLVTDLLPRSALQTRTLCDNDPNQRQDPSRDAGAQSNLITLAQPTTARVSILLRRTGKPEASRQHFDQSEDRRHDNQPIHKPAAEDRNGHAQIRLLAVKPAAIDRPSDTATGSWPPLRRRKKAASG